MGERRLAALERNVRLYPWYEGLVNTYFWMPVFFLYFSEHLSLGRVLQLEAVYYATVVLLEIPSGYFSDTFGRRRTLIVSTSALALSYALFFVGRSFPVFAAGQVCLAMGLAFKSGTDTALHFDSLSALDRGSEYAAREAHAHRIALLGRAVAALGGGLAATWQLRFAYGLSLLAALATLAIVLLITEPWGHGRETRRGFVRQIGACLRQLGNRSLAWLLGFAVLMIVINHVPYELYQPYLDLLLKDRGIDLPGKGTPLVTGMVTAAALLLASWATANSIRLRDRIGIKATLLATTTMQVLIMAAMGLLLHEVVLALILLRSVPAAVMEPPLRAAVTPQLPRSLRATYLSLQSLAGRLAFSGVLVVLSLGPGPRAAPDWPAISLMSLACAALGATGLILLAATAKLCLSRLPTPPRRNDNLR
ncbi:MAG: MFS transporter [Planctomycetota bacterium]